MDFLARQKKMREHLATTRFDALLINHLPNIQYLCGFTGSAGLLLIEERGSVFFSDVRYDTQAREEGKPRSSVKWSMQHARAVRRRCRFRRSLLRERGPRYRMAALLTSPSLQADS